MSENKIAAFVATKLQEIQAGQVRLSQLLSEAKKAEVPPARLEAVKKQRDTITAKLASSGLIDPSGAAEIRESLHAPGGVEFLFEQAINHFDSQSKESKTASTQAQLGQASERKTAMNRVTNKQTATFQSPYHR